MRNIKLLIEYDGTNFLGWQSQKQGRTVQQELENALARVLGQKVRLNVAGRTDTGVHAAGQAANFLTSTSRSLDAILKGTNTLIGPDVRLAAVREANLKFHARFDAKSKVYRYTFLLKPSALKRNYGWYVKYALDKAAMINAGSHFLGRHDFRTFTVRKTERNHYFCTVKQLRWVCGKNELSFLIEGDRFLHNMVRIIAGTLLDVGRGKIEPTRITTMINGRDRKLAGQTAPAHGLCLVKVKYR